MYKERNVYINTRTRTYIILHIQGVSRRLKRREPTLFARYRSGRATDTSYARRMNGTSVIVRAICETAVLRGVYFRIKKNEINATTDGTKNSASGRYD